MSEITLMGCIIMQPNPYGGNICPVEYIWQSLKDEAIVGFVKLYSTGKSGKFLEEFSQHTNETTVPAKIILICHGNKRRYAFDSIHGYKDSEWWDSSEQFVIAHSCFSAHILSHYSWNGKFRDWVGSTDKVWYSLDKTSIKRWRHFFVKLSEKLSTIDSGKAMAEAIKRLYHESMYSIGGNTGKEVYRTSIQRNLSVLTCKEIMKN